MPASDDSQQFFHQGDLRSIIAEAGRQGRPPEVLSGEIDPSEDPAVDEDDCRPIDAVSIDSHSFDDRSGATTQTTDYPTRTTDSFQPIPRTLRQTVLNKDNVTVDSTSSNTSSQANIYESALKDQADRHYNSRLLGEVLTIWCQEALSHKQDGELADLRHDEKLARQYLEAMRVELYKTEDVERKRRLKMFIAWRNRGIAIRAIAAWIVKHRENFVHKMSVDAENARAASNALSKWRNAAMQAQERKSAFRQFYYACKFGRRWKEIVLERRMLRSMAILEQRYHDYKKDKEAKDLRKSLANWHAKTAAISAMDITAVQHNDEKTAQRANELGHQALRTMYVGAVQGLEHEAKADEQYRSSIAVRVLSPDGQWRGQARRTADQERSADEFAYVRDQSRAQHAIRLMRRGTIRARQLEHQADDHQTKVEKRLAGQSLKRWRVEVAMRRGETLIPEAPATPAARLTALRLYQSTRG